MRFSPSIHPLVLALLILFASVSPGTGATIRLTVEGSIEFIGSSGDPNFQPSPSALEMGLVTGDPFQFSIDFDSEDTSLNPDIGLFSMLRYSVTIKGQQFVTSTPPGGRLSISQGGPAGLNLFIVPSSLLFGTLNGLDLLLNTFGFIPQVLSAQASAFPNADPNSIPIDLVFSDLDSVTSGIFALEFNPPTASTLDLFMVTIHDLSFSAIPEPGTGLLLGLGCILLSVQPRRFRDPAIREREDRARRP